MQNAKCLAAGPCELPTIGLWPDHPAATLFNDLAIALFVLDVFLVIVR